MIAALALSCARSAPAEPVQAPPPEPALVATEAGRYRVRVERDTAGELVLVAHTPDGAPVTDAWVALVVDGEGMRVDPGECDSVGEQRCDHPDGRYLAVRPPGSRPSPTPSGEVRIAVDGPAGLDRAVLPLPVSR